VGRRDFFWKTRAERKNRINRQKREGCRSETWREEKKLREFITIPKKCSKTINTYRVVQVIKNAGRKYTQKYNKRGI
jgi:hypothetical protein